MSKAYTLEEKRVALTALLTTGNVRAAAEETGIPYRTLARWPHTHRELLEQVHAELEPQIQKAQIMAFEQIIARSADTANRSLDAMDQALTEGNAKDAQAFSTVGRNVVTMAGIVYDKKSHAKGEPNVRVQNISAEDALKSLASMVGVTLDGTAEELPSVALEAQTGSTNA